MADAQRYPNHVLYYEEHDWALIDRDSATFGITWYAQDALGTIVFWDPPAVGAQLVRGQPYAEVESVKAVSDVVAPLSGEVLEANQALADNPEVLNSDPYGGGWLVRVRLSAPAQVESLMDADAYSRMVDGD